MTVYLFTGTPGSGKSLHMAQLIYWRCFAKKPVIANFEINAERVPNRARTFSLCGNDVLSPKALEDYARWYWDGRPVKEGEIKLFIDEAQLLFNSREWNKSDRAAWVAFFTQHRKMGYDVYLVCQFADMLDKQIRSLCEYEVKHRKVNNVGWVGKLIGLCAFGQTVVVGVTYWMGQKMRLGAEWTLARRKYYGIYDTFKTF